MSFDQNPSPGMSYVVRAQGDPAALTGQIRIALAQMTPQRRARRVRTFDEVVATATRTSGLLSWLSVLFGVLAAALAILGIYSVMSYTVAQRERELAIRAAVGASRSSLLSMVLREGLAAERRGHRRRSDDRVRRVGRVAQPALRRERHRSAGVRRLGARSCRDRDVRAT